MSKGKHTEREREREREGKKKRTSERETEREREKERKRERELVGKSPILFWKAATSCPVRVMVGARNMLY
jgi:hypothetical protein